MRDAVLDHAAEDGVVAPHAELDLNRRDRRDGARLFDLADGDVAQADRLDEPVAPQLLERPNARRQRRPRIRRVQLIELDALDAERLPAGRAGLGQLPRAAVRHPRPARTRQAALGRHDDGATIAGPRAQRAGDQPLVVPDLRRLVSVGVGRIEQTHSGIERRMDDGDGSPVVAIGCRRQAHAAHPDARQAGQGTRHVGSVGPRVAAGAARGRGRVEGTLDTRTSHCHYNPFARGCPAAKGDPGEMEPHTA